MYQYAACTDPKGKKSICCLSCPDKTLAGSSCELAIADARERNDAFWLLFDWINEPNPIQSIMNPISTTFYFNTIADSLP